MANLAEADLAGGNAKIELGALDYSVPVSLSEWPLRVGGGPDEVRVRNNIDKPERDMPITSGV